MKNPTSFYSEGTTEQIARDMLGMLLIYDSNKGKMGGLIVETEAYLGQQDSAAHAFKGRRSPSIEPLYGPPGTVYIFSTHGGYCLNVATQAKDIPQGILIRGIQPTIGINLMKENRKKTGPELTNGPAKLMQAFGISDKKMNFEIFGQSKLDIVQQTGKRPKKIIETKRVGVSKEGDWAGKPFRYYVSGNPYVSGIRKRDIQDDGGWI